MPSIPALGSCLGPMLVVSIVLLASTPLRAARLAKVGERSVRTRERAREFRRTGEIARKGRRAVARDLLRREALLRPDGARSLWLARLGSRSLTITSHGDGGGDGLRLRVDVRAVRTSIAASFGDALVAMQRAELERENLPDAVDRVQAVPVSVEDIAELATHSLGADAALARDSMTAFGDQLGRAIALEVRRGTLPAGREVVLALDGRLGLYRDTFAAALEARVARSAGVRLILIAAE